MQSILKYLPFAKINQPEYHNDDDDDRDNNRY